MPDLTLLIQQLLPAAIEWAQDEAALAAANGRPLSARESAIARKVGVSQPERIRVCVVRQMPAPSREPLRSAAAALGLLGPGTTGLALDHSVFMREGHQDERLLAHECRHVQQCEAAGSLAQFLRAYFTQLAQHGYTDAPFEIDARNHEGVTP